MWSIHHVSICAPKLQRTRDFLGGLVGLPENLDLVPPGRSGDLVAYGTEGRGIRAISPDPAFRRRTGPLYDPTMRGHVAITVQDLNAVASRLDAAGVSYFEGGEHPPRIRQIFACDPSFNLIEFNEIAGGVPDGVQPWEIDWGWGIHHVNLMAHDVRETVGFFAEIAGMEEGAWTRPEGADEGAFSIDPAELTIFPLGDGNRGLHVIRPDPLFARRNGFVVNPSIGGHPAIMVPDIRAVMRRMDEAGWHYDDAGVYAMPGMHQIYTYDPAMNVVEINQRVA